MVEGLFIGLVEVDQLIVVDFELFTRFAQVSDEVIIYQLLRNSGFLLIGDRHFQNFLEHTFPLDSR